MQCYLPAGYKHCGKKSRAISYAPDVNVHSARSARRTEEQAMACLKAWSLEWFSTLSDLERQGLEAAAEPAAKRARKQ